MNGYHHTCNSDNQIKNVNIRNKVILKPIDQNLLSKLSFNEINFNSKSLNPIELKKYGLLKSLKLQGETIENNAKATKEKENNIVIIKVPKILRSKYKYADLRKFVKKTEYILLKLD